MIFFILMLKIVLCQDLIIWLRVTSISQSMIKEDLYQEFCYLDDYAISIEYQNDLYIVIYQGLTMNHLNKIIEGNWIQLDIHKQGNIVIDEKNLNINSIDQINFTQIKKNYNDFYLEITKDDKYNNFILQNWRQPYFYSLTYDTFISDQDALVTLWFKLIIDYNTINCLSIQSYKDYSYHNIEILQIFQNQLIIFIDNQKKSFKINGMQWNNVIIQIQNNINVQVITNNQIIQEKYAYNIQHIINKQIFIEQEGLYIGHLSIQYKDVQFYCSPGCITCQNNKCQECFQGQLLIYNQCLCQKFYQSQNIDGQCSMYPDLYEQNQQELDYDLFYSNFCLFGFIYSQGNCYPCPWFQEELCSDCIYKIQINDNQILDCWQNGLKVRYILDQDQYIPYINHSFTKISKQVTQQIKILKNYTLLLTDKQDKIQFRPGLVYKGQLRCPYNCAQCQKERKLNINYCINLIEIQNYTQNIQGIPIQNNQMNTFVLNIQVINVNSNMYYFHKRYYKQLKSLINNIEINSIILTGIHIVQLVFELQIQYIDQFLFDLETNLNDLKQKINKVKAVHYLSFHIPFIHLEIKSNMKYFIILDQYVQIDNIDKLTIQNMHFVSSFRYIKFHVSIIIMKNIYFNSTEINAYIICDKLLMQNIIFENIVDFEVNLFKIYTNYIKLQNLMINNCTLDKVALLQLSPNYQNQQLYLIIDQFYISQTILILTDIIDIQQKNCVINLENLNINYSNLVNSNIIYSKTKNTKLKLIKNFFMFDSQIYKSLFSEFMKEQIDTIIISNCTLENITYLFKIIQEGDDTIRIINILLIKINLLDSVQLFFIQTNSAVDVSFIIIKDVQMNYKLNSLFHFKIISLQLSFIKLKNLKINSFVTIICSQVFLLYINTIDSQIQEVFKIQSDFLIQMHKIRFENISLFFRILNLKSCQLTKLQALVFANFQLNQFETINQFIHLDSNFRGQVLMEKILFLNNQINETNFNVNFIEIVCPFQVISLSSLYFNKNFIKTSIGNIITIHSNQSLINNVYIKNLTLINDQISNALDLNGSFIELQNLKFQSIKLVNCHIIGQKGLKLFLIFGFFNNITLTNSKLIYITTYEIFQTSIIKLSASIISTNDGLIKINSENIEGELDFYYSHISNIQLKKDLLSLSSDIFRIRIYRVKFQNVISNNPIYLIQQPSAQKTKIIQLLELVIDNSQFGLVKVQSCDYFMIIFSKFTNIGFFEQFIISYRNLQFTLQKAVFKNVKISKFLYIQQSNLIKNKIFLEQILIQNLKLQHNDSLIVFNNGTQQTFSQIYFINNSCNCSIFLLQNYSNISRIKIYNSLFSLNNVTQMFDISNNNIKNQILGSEQQLINYIYINDIQEFSTQQQQNKDYTVKLKINDHNLESYIQMEYKVNNIDQNQLKSKYDSFYLPSGQFLNQYKILNLDQLSFKQYINKFVFISDMDFNCDLNLKQINIIDNLNQIIQTQSIKINQDLSNTLKLQMDPYNYKYKIQVSCQYSNINSVLQFKIKPFPCQMGEYYYDQQCNLCKIKYQYNTLKHNQNNCDYFDKSIVIQMQQGLLKLQIGYWRPDFHNKYIQQCKKYSQQQNCQGGWQVGDQSCYQGYIGALCSECDIYNQQGHNHYSKIEEKCVSCSNGNFKLIVYITTIFFYQLTQTTLAARRSYQFISNKKKLIQQNRFYIILKSLQVDQISICLKILQDMYIKLILINKLQLEIPDIINIGFNIFPQQLVNEGLYCNIYFLGPNILVLELIYIFIFTIILIQVSNFIYIIIVYKKLIQQSITYITSIFQYGYKQSYFYISYLLLSQIIYVEVSNELYLVGNQQYSYKYYKHITIIILPIFIVYSIVIPLLIIFIINKKRSNIQKFSKYWAYYIQDYNSKCQFWELYQLIKYSALLFIYFYYYLERNNQLMFFIIAILIDLIIQKNISIYNIKNLNQIYFETQLKLIALLILFNYYQVLKQPLNYIFFVLILILNYYILKPIFYNIFRIIIAKYIHYTIKYQNKLVVRYPRFMNFQRRYSLGQNPDRAKENFQKLIKLFKNNKLGHHKYAKPIVVHHAPYNTSYLELQTSKELEMITL